MLEHDRIEVSKGTDFSKIESLRGRVICHYWYFLNINFRLQPEGCNGCHDSMQKALNFNDAAIATVKENA